MNFTVNDLEIYLVIMVRITAFVFTAPLFSIRSIPQRAKVLFSLALALITYFSVPVEPLIYEGIIGYTVLVVKEAVCGLSLGFFSNICTYILSFSGQFTDLQIGFSMMNEFDPVSGQSVTISSNVFTYAVFIIMICTNMHLYILRAIIDSFTLVPVGLVNINANIYELIGSFLINYMALGFRIVLPVFGSILIANTLLAVLAKIAPQMNMFVIGYQLKIFIGLFVLSLMMLMLPAICDKLFTEMMEMMRLGIRYFTP
ncbi:MAG: flagellar biosynthetic protein FliR [Lachnospiraceae bacterium]|nr:flagellar biosynthetic protein FliR [Lachnospiraceae bacterium]